MKQMGESSTDASSVGLLSFPLKTLGVDSTWEKRPQWRLKMQSISTRTHYAASLLLTSMFGMKKENHYKRNIGPCIRISAFGICIKLKNPVSVGLVGQMNSDVFNAQSQFTGSRMLWNHPVEIKILLPVQSLSA